jgi:hypothetical protein
MISNSNAKPFPVPSLTLSIAFKVPLMLLIGFRSSGI